MSYVRVTKWEETKGDTMKNNVLNDNEKSCLDNASYFTAVRGRTASQRTRKQFDTLADAEKFASEFGDGRTMIYAVSVSGMSAHIGNA